MMRLKPFDFLFFGLSLAAVAVSFFALKKGGEKTAHLVVDADGTEFVYPLDEDRTLEFEGEIGKSVIRIEDGKAFFEDSPCPNKLCVQMPAVQNEYDWAACLPNQIFIRVEK